jgi:Ca2+-binding EF-hand superfamily protein
MAVPQDVNDLLERKIDTCFGHVDVDGDGYFEAPDVMAMAARMIAYQNLSFDSSPAQRLFSAFGEFMGHIVERLDVDGDGRITPDEWRKGMIGTFGEDTASFDKLFRPLAEAIWSLCDRDGDGRVEAEEFLCFQRAVGTSSENRQIAFDKLDRNGDGSLSVEEILGAYRDYYTSRDPKAPGNWLYGDVWDGDIRQATTVSQ